MKRRLLILSLGFSPLLIVFGVIRISHNPIIDAMLALAGCASLSWALLNMFEVVSAMYTTLDDATKAVKIVGLDVEDHLVDQASTQLTIAVLNKIHEIHTSIEEEEG
jgi:hypothetical protein|tara:strand:- start:14 stop:334 length:321 start_codon:yes stop_codon:yes gene_type:complete